MKKIALFAAAMLLCAGMAMAQAPVKKDANKTKTENVQATKDKEQVAGKKGCGNCPHHQQCNKGTETAVKADSDKSAQKSCCSDTNKGTENKACQNKEKDKAVAPKK